MPKKKPPAALSKDNLRLKVVKAPGKAAKGPIYQVKITLNNVKPPIWRRVLTKDCSLADLHDMIQMSMGWHDGHLHFFEVGGERFGLPEQWEQDFIDDDLPLNSRKVKLSQVVAQGFKKLRYIYDMGDGWDHTVLIEKTVEAEPGGKYPRCIDGKRAAHPKIAAGRGATATCLTPSATRRTNGTPTWWSGSAISSTPRHSTWTRRTKGWRGCDAEQGPQRTRSRQRPKGTEVSFFSLFGTV